jgi:hypothetical protein
MHVEQGCTNFKTIDLKLVKDVGLTGDCTEKLYQKHHPKTFRIICVVKLAQG